MRDIKDYLEQTNTVLLTKDAFEHLKERASELDKIRAEIAEYGSMCVVYAITDKTKTDKGIEELVADVLSEAKRQVLDIIDKYKAERTDT